MLMWGKQTSNQGSCLVIQMNPDYLPFSNYVFKQIEKSCPLAFSKQNSSNDPRLPST